MSSLANNYSRRKISFKKGKGSFLYSYKGEKYLDFIQGIAVNSLGHSNPYLNKALYYQSKRVWHVSNAFEIPEGEKLARRLTKVVFPAPEGEDKIIITPSLSAGIKKLVSFSFYEFYSITYS